MGIGMRLLTASTIGEQQNRRAPAHQLDRLAAQIVQRRQQIARRIEDAFQHRQRQIARQIMLPPMQRFHL